MSEHIDNIFDKNIELHITYVINYNKEAENIMKNWDKGEKIMNKVKDILKNYYSEYDEEGRLEKDNAHRMEFITTTKYIEKYLKPEDRMIEIGAATGRYSLYFAKKGFKVYSVELLEENLNILKNKIEPEMKINTMQANAMDLSMYKDNSFNITLCLGPLYHLFSNEDKLKAISEAIRITKPGGKIFLAYITNDSVILNYGLKKGNLKRLAKMCDENFKVPDIPEEIFSVSYIKDFNKLMMKFKNIKKIKEVGIDGIAPTIGAPYINNLSEEEFNIWVKYHLANCEREDIMGYSSHILYIAEK